MRKIKKINGWLIVRFNDREKRIYEGLIGSFGVIDAEEYTGDLDMDRCAMEYDNAETLEEAIELARGLESEEDIEDTGDSYILVTEGADHYTEDEVNPQLMIQGYTGVLESRVGSERFPEVDPVTARHQLMGFKAALNRLGILDEEDTAVEPEFFGKVKDALPRSPEDLLAYVCDCVCKHRADNQDAQDALCQSCQIGRLYEEAGNQEFSRWKTAQAYLEQLREKIADPELTDMEAGVLGGRAWVYIQAMRDTGFIDTAQAQEYADKISRTLDSRPPADTFRYVPKNGKLTRRVYQLGLKMLESCPDNDCTIYRNLFRQAKELDDKIGFLEGYADQELRRGLRKIYSDLEQMYLMSSAVRCYRAEASEERKAEEAADDTQGTWVSRYVSDYGLAFGGCLYSSEELMKHAGERVGVRKTARGVEARINPGGELIGLLEPVDLNALGIRPYKITDILKDDARPPYGPVDKVAERLLEMNASLREREKEPPVGQTAPGDGCPFRGKGKRLGKLMEELESTTGAQVPGASSSQVRPYSPGDRASGTGYSAEELTGSQFR